MERSIDISIIMATFNRAHLISETLESILSQSFQNWECLIIDDGSKDDTGKVIQKFTANDSRFIYLKRTQNYKKGLPGCRNQGLDFAIGELVIFFDDDDIVHPENLQTCFDLLSGNKFQFCRYNKKPFRESADQIQFKQIQNSKFKPFKIQDLDKMIIGEIPFASCCVMWDKNCFGQERFNVELMYAEEWECYSRILSRGYEGLTTDAVLYFNRKHHNSNTGEFHNNDPLRKNSKIEAAKLIISHLAKKDLLNEPLVKFFIRLGFLLKEHSVVDYVLEKSKGNFFKKMKYKIGYKLYPIIRPVLKLKGEIKKLGERK